MRKGIAVSPGIVVGSAYRVESILSSAQVELLDDPSTIPGEVERFDQAVAEAITELETVASRVAQQLGEADAAIFRTHLQIVKDRSLSSKVHDLIRGKQYTALAALHSVLTDYAAIFARMDQEMFRERLADIRDALTRIALHLTVDRPPEPQAGEDPIVLVAFEILPSQAMSLGDLSIGGIVTEAGGSTSHAAILSRSRGIPAVSGVPDITKDVHTGDTIIVDGRDGLVLVRPDPETAAAYRKMQREFFLLKDKLVANRDLPARSSDGMPASLLANINSVADAEAACAVGATGVGLFRTEYLFIAHPSVPDEEEQYEHYRQIVEAAPNRTVTIRTLDLGGDKTVPYLGRRNEANPFMGWRSIRMSFEHPRLFEQQIRAILRAAVHGSVSMLFPMITTLEELRYVNTLVGETKANLRRERIEFEPNVKMGVMIEVPAAAVCIDAILRETDFVSIGSNDLVQYLVAADRDNPKVAHLCEPLSPAVLRVLQSIQKACHDTGTHVTVCGEMAGQVKSVLTLFGMGYRRFSMSPAFVPTIKALLASVTTAQAERFAHQVLQFKTSTEIRTYLNARIHEVSSGLEMFDIT